jgi:hypothetical protein
MAKYIGAWQAGKVHGQGKQYSSNGELVHEGYWISDEYYGPKAPDSGRVKMVESGGIYYVPVVINDALKLDFIVDSGASDVSIPADVVLTLMRTGTINGSDFIGTETYRLAKTLEVHTCGPGPRPGRRLTCVVKIRSKSGSAVTADRKGVFHRRGMCVDGSAGRPATGRRWKSVTVKV